ncbi:MAG: glycosyltransferase family 1 protein [Spirochaetes bacterium]|nr:MAG: glycosyltransferase family 1 protein [Spirochaetota bacterium]
MRICILCYRGNPYSGGQGVYLKYVAEEMVRQGHEVHAIVGPPYPTHMKGVTTHFIHNNEYFVKKGLGIINPEDPFDILGPLNTYEYLSTRLNAFSEISAFSFRAFVKLKTLMKTTRFDVILDNQCVGYGLLLMKHLGVPVIATIHHPLSIDLEAVLERASSFKNRLKGVMFYPVLMQRIVSKRLDHVITVSEDSKRTIHRDFGVPLEKQSVVYNGLDTSIFKPARGVKRKKGKMVFVGNVEDGKKGFAYLLKALPRIQSDLHLTVVDGASPHHRITNALIGRLDLSGRLEFTGKATNEELVRHYSEAELVIVPSVYEGFGFPAAEAMACGAPVIASDGGALPEVVGDAGVVVPARDERALAKAIDALYQDKQRMKKFSRMGMERVKKTFTWEGAVTQMTGVFNRFVR